MRDPARRVIYARAMARLLLVFSLLAGCTAQRAACFAPDLVVRAAARQSQGDEHARVEWALDARLAWRFARRMPVLERSARRPLRASTRLECTVPALCVWEARERAAALRRAEEP